MYVLSPPFSHTVIEQMERGPSEGRDDLILLSPMFSTGMCIVDEEKRIEDGGPLSTIAQVDAEPTERANRLIYIQEYPPYTSATKPMFAEIKHIHNPTDKFANSPRL